MKKKGLIITSENQKIIIVNNDIEFVLIRAGFTDYNFKKNKIKDKNFEENYNYLKENNIKVGVFYESRATTMLQAKQEVDFFLDIIKNKKFDYPIAIKIEDNHNTIIYSPYSQEIINKKLLRKILKTMYNKLENNGYLPMIMTYESWYKTKFKKMKCNFLLDNDQNDIIYLDIHNLSKYKQKYK